MSRGGGEVPAPYFPRLCAVVAELFKKMFNIFAEIFEKNFQNYIKRF